jgi:hypothetical protein
MIPEIKPCPLDVAEISSETFHTSDEQSLNNTSPADKFVVVFGLPQCFAKINTKNLFPTDNKISENSIYFTIHSLPTPSILVPADAQGILGRKLKFSTHTRPAYDPIALKFAIDSRYQNYWTIYKWLDILASDEENNFDSDNLIKGGASVKTYSTILTVYAVDEYNRPKIQFNYFGAFPTALSPIEFDQKNPNQIDCSATFEYSFFNAVPMPVN